ncbi:hypothetical protein GTO10_02450 [Candidatus Saccharibacteria bacterium]|nr:hypothetical protein [Candidatus Saccharibacteria bacterium]
MEIRKRLQVMFVVFVVAALLGFVYYEKIVTFSLTIFRLEGVNFAFTSPFQFINLAVSSGLAAGIIASLPLLLFQLFSFLKPALSKREYRFVLTLLPLAILLFVTGFFYGVAVMKYVIGLFYQNVLQLSITNLLDVSTFLSQIIATSSLMGAAFEFPIVLTALVNLNVVGYDKIVSQRPLVYLICLIFAALLPPTDILSLALLTVPLIVLFESTLALNRVFLKV